jgi:hypothetical protein
MNSTSRRQRVPALRELQPDQEERRDLRRERLRRGDADLEPVRVHTESTSRVIREPIMFVDRDGARTQLAREFHRLDRVARLA